MGYLFVSGQVVSGSHSRTLSLIFFQAAVPCEISILRLSSAGPRGAIPFCMESLQTFPSNRAEIAAGVSPVGRVLVADGRTEAVTHPARVLQALRAREFDVVLMDLNYTRDTTAGGEGLELVSLDRREPSIGRDDGLEYGGPGGGSDAARGF
jgi:hypothetical protein